MEPAKPNIVTSSEDSNYSTPSPNPFFQKHFLSLVLLLIIGSTTAFSVFLTQQKQDIRNYAKESAPESSSTVNLILHLTKDPQTGEITVEEAVANNGFSPFIPQVNLNDTNLYFIDQVVGEKVVSQQSIRFHTFVFGDEKDHSTKELVNSNEYFEKPQAIISIPFRTDAVLKIRSKKDGQNYTLPMNRIQQALNSVDLTDPGNARTSASQNSDGFIDMVFISDHYSNFTPFDEEVSKSMDRMLDVTPYNEYKNIFRVQKIYNTQEICKLPNAKPCNYDLAFQIASQVNYDYIVIQVNTTDPYCPGRAWVGGPILVVGRDCNDDPPGYTLAHEMGHALAWLNDEYSYKKPHTEPDIFSNCDTTSSCNEWSGVPNTNCIPRCGYTDWFRPTENKCMMDEYTMELDPVDEPNVRGYLNLYAPIPTDSPFPGDGNWKWTTGWCVDLQKTCINAGFQRPAYVYDYPNFCSDPNNPYNCSGYQYFGGGGSTPTPTQPAPTNPPNNGTLTVKVVQKGSGVKYPNKVTVREWYSSDCPNGCNSSCQNLICKAGRNVSYDPNGCGASGCAKWSNYTPNVGYYIGICETCIDSGVINLPDNWEITKFGCGSSSKLWTPGSGGATCTIEVENTESNRKIVQGYIFHDDETDPNAVKNASTVEPPIAGASLTLYRVKPNGNSTLIETRKSNSKDKQNNFAFKITQNGNYRFDPPANIPGYRLHPCSQVTKPKNIPTDNRYFYCTETNGNLTLRQWTPNSKNPSKKITSGLIPFTGTTVNVDFPLENAQ